MITLKKELQQYIKLLIIKIGCRETNVIKLALTDTYYKEKRLKILFFNLFIYYLKAQQIDRFLSVSKKYFQFLEFMLLCIRNHGKFVLSIYVLDAYRNGLELNFSQ